MCEIMRNINKEISVKVAEIYTHINSAKQNINELKTPKGNCFSLGVLFY